MHPYVNGMFWQKGGIRASIRDWHVLAKSGHPCIHTHIAYRCPRRSNIETTPRQRLARNAPTWRRGEWGKYGRWRQPYLGRESLAIVAARPNSADRPTYKASSYLATPSNTITHTRVTKAMDFTQARLSTYCARTFSRRRQRYVRWPWTAIGCG